MSLGDNRWCPWDGAANPARADALHSSERERDEQRRWRLLAPLAAGSLAFTVALLAIAVVPPLRLPPLALLGAALALQLTARPRKPHGAVDPASRRLLIGAMIACSVAAVPGGRAAVLTILIADVFLLTAILESGMLLSVTSPFYVSAYGTALIVIRAWSVHGSEPLAEVAWWRGLVFVAAAILSAVNALHMRRALQQADRTDEVERLYSILQSSYRTLEENNTETHRQAAEVSQLNSQLISMQEELQHSNHELEEMNRLLHEQATTDCMTGLANHRAFQQALRTQSAQALRHRLPLSLLMIDVDHFKKYNDSYGHPAGDEALHTIGELVRSETRTGDVPARYGGEEFAILLPYTDQNAAAEVAERIRAATEFAKFDHAPLTISIGVAALHLCADDADGLVDAADNALYTAKQAGRNRVVCAPASGNQRPPHGGGNVEATGAAGRRRIHAFGNDRPVLTPGGAVDGDLERHGGGIEGLLQEPSGPLLAALLHAIELRNKETSGHSYRVACYAIRIAGELQGIYNGLREEMPLLQGVTPDDVRGLAIGAVLHDIGKFQVPDYILWKTSKLTAEENAALRLHTVAGAQLVGSIPELAPALPVVRHHHERWDGRGYPDGLVGDAIPLIARICAVADTFDILTTETRYHSAAPYREAGDMIATQAGRKFDPLVARAFGLVPEGEWAKIRTGYSGGQLDQAA